jgi:predicted ATPase
MSLEFAVFSVSNYKSIQSLNLMLVPNLLVFVGKNNAGKSNIFDVWNFLAEASSNLQAALEKRGGSFREIVRGKQADSIAQIRFVMTIPERVRRDTLKGLEKWAGGSSRQTIVDSSHLSSLTYCLTIENGRFSEELQTENAVQHAPPISLIKTEGDSTRWSGGWTAVTYAADNQQPMPLQGNFHQPGSGSGGVRLCLAMVNHGYPPVAGFAQEMRNYLTRIHWISPIRKCIPSLAIQGQRLLDPEASNLADVLHSLYTNDIDRFREIEAETRRLVPNVGSFFTPTAGNTTTLGIRDHGNSAIFYALDQISSGTRSAVAIITRIVCTEPGAWICVEEPETHLHPEAQAAMGDFLRRQAADKRIFVSTHSPVVASRAPIESVFLVSRGPENGTIVEPVFEESVNHVIEELGIRPSYNLEAEALVFVEGQDDVPVYEAWARKYGIGRAVQFVDAEGWCNMEYFANAKVIQNRRVRVLPWVIFDGDTERAPKISKIKEQLISRLSLPADRILTLNVSELEGHLLDPSALLRAFPAIRLLEEDLEERFAPSKGKRNQKKILDKLFQEYGLGRYVGAFGAKIASEMRSIPTEIEEFFRRIKTAIGCQEEGW